MFVELVAQQQKTNKENLYLTYLREHVFKNFSANYINLYKTFIIINCFLK